LIFYSLLLTLRAREAYNAFTQTEQKLYCTASSHNFSI
jgi:hypothetical protein